MALRRENRVGVIFLLLTALCWGFVAVTVKQLTGSVDPYTISFFRSALATVVFALLFVRQKGDWRRIRWLLPWILIGAVGRAGNYLLYNAGLVYTPSNAATILAPVQTIAIVVLAYWIIAEGLRTKWPGIALSMAGLALIWWNGQDWQSLLRPEYFWGYLLLILAGVATSFQFCSQKVLSSDFSGLEILLPVFALSALITAPVAWSAGGFSRPYSVETWALLIFLGIILTGASYFFMAEGYRRCDATTAVVITNVSVFFTLFWSWVLLREAVGFVMVLGALAGVAGAVMIVLADRRRLG